MCKDHVRVVVTSGFFFYKVIIVLGDKNSRVSVLQPIRKSVRFRMRQRLSADLTAEERQEEKPRRGVPEVVMGNFAETSRCVQTRDDAYISKT